WLLLVQRAIVLCLLGLLMSLIGLQYMLAMLGNGGFDRRTALFELPEWANVAAILFLVTALPAIAFLPVKFYREDGPWRYAFKAYAAVSMMPAVILAQATIVELP